jgi:cytochrome c oxidase accessory protein FixG
VVFFVLIVIYLVAPFLSIGGRPLLRLDMEHRRFFFFGETFNPQDAWLVLGFGLIFVFGLLLVTAWRGRVWCGWACPQTVFLEGVYRPIERWLEGPAHERRRLAESAWTVRKLFLRLAKWVPYFGISAGIAHTAAAIFVGPEALLQMILLGPAASPVAFGLTTAFTAILFFNFVWFREQFCVVLCPYGRMQSVLHDEDSITVAYDYTRGEPRGKIRKGDPKSHPVGDCVDCGRCVAVCPTAIDIRNGLQMECLACLQCVDACDEVMDRLGRKRGLIGLYSLRELGGKGRKLVRPRLVLYGSLMFLALSFVVWGWSKRTPFELQVLRPRGGLPFVVEGDVVKNVYELHVIYKGSSPGRIGVEVVGPEGSEILVGTKELQLGSFEDARVPVVVSIEKGKYPGESRSDREVRFRLQEIGGRKSLERRASWLAPPGF